MRGQRLADPVRTRVSLCALWVWTCSYLAGRRVINLQRDVFMQHSCNNSLRLQKSSLCFVLSRPASSRYEMNGGCQLTYRSRIQCSANNFRCMMRWAFISGGCASVSLRSIRGVTSRSQRRVCCRANSGNPGHHDRNRR